MAARFRSSPLAWLKLAAVVLIVKVTMAVVLVYRDYLPPNFQSDFLFGRETYFWRGYHLAFYAHLVAGPLSMVLGLLLMSERLRVRWPMWHRWLGRTQAINVLLFLAPSGLAMAFWPQAGALAGFGFALLSLATAGTILQGWRLAIARRFAEHRVWMTRNFLLLCSAIVLRLLAGFALTTGIAAAWIDPYLPWLSMLPLGLYEVARRTRGRQFRAGDPLSIRRFTTVAAPSTDPVLHAASDR
jgi:hypothetical protein